MQGPSPGPPPRPEMTLEMEAESAALKQQRKDRAYHNNQIPGRAQLPPHASYSSRHQRRFYCSLFRQWMWWSICLCDASWLRCGIEKSILQLQIQSFARVSFIFPHSFEARLPDFRTVAQRNMGTDPVGNLFETRVLSLSLSLFLFFFLGHIIQRAPISRWHHVGNDYIMMFSFAAAKKSVSSILRFPVYARILPLPASYKRWADTSAG